VNFLVGLNQDNWPTAIPLDRVSSIRVAPEDLTAVVEFRDDTSRAEVLDKAGVCCEVEMMWTLRALATIEKEDA
jgi:hypothetical protein